MKNIPVLLVFISFCALTLGCDKCKDNCGSDVSISAVLPNNNPVGYEVLIKTEGFSNAAQVVFGTEKASSRPGGKAGEIIAKVPAGLSGNVEISVEEGDCIGRVGDFIVSGALPIDVQHSLPDIILPTTPALYPTDGFTNFWRNAAKNDAGINLKDTVISGVKVVSPSSKEFDFSDSYFDNNPVTGTINISTNVIYLEIDRRAKGGTIEHFDGQFIAVPIPNVIPANAQYAILLTSRETGRQLLIYYA